MGRPPSPSCDHDQTRTTTTALIKKGPWTPEEDKLLTDFIAEHGHRSWRALPTLAGLNRCGKSCRLRWTNYLRPDIKRGKLTDEEERHIIELHATLGNKWSAIAARLPGRTDNEIKNYWNTHIRKKLLRMGIDPVTHQPCMPDLSLLSACFRPAVSGELLAAADGMAAAAKLHVLQVHNLLQALSVSAAGSGRHTARSPTPQTTMAAGLGTDLLPNIGGGASGLPLIHLSSLVGGLLQLSAALNQTAPCNSSNYMGTELNTYDDNDLTSNDIINASNSMNGSSYDSGHHNNSPAANSTPCSLLPASPAAETTTVAVDNYYQQATARSSTVSTADPWEGRPLEIEDFTSDSWKDVLDQLLS